MTAGKQRTLRTRAFGAEPGMPDLSSLADWVAERRGSRGDLTTFLLEQSLAPQQEAEVGVPCAGGKFYRNHILESLLGQDGQAITGEIGVDHGTVIADMADLVAMAKGVSVAMPAPHLLGLADQYFHDEDEVSLSLTGAYRSLMRAMRDAGCGGHVLICDRIDEEEVSALAKKKVFFFHPAPAQEDFEILLEHQQQVAVRRQDLGIALSLTDEYDIFGLVILDPDSAAIRSALLHRDSEKIVVGGYCTADCPDYWKSLVASAVYRT
ncbi:MAG TPA: hypothetical protein P5217_09650 [Methanoregulaceae archaeon]|nr:hypothetical protein [Methanoregulaceae archaeon]